jgi:hypothetical protein
LSDELSPNKEQEMTEPMDIDDRSARSAAPPVDAPSAAAPTGGPAQPLYQSEGDWLDDGEDLPPRPRRRLLTPIPLALLAALAIACGFIAGVLVEKGQSASTGGGGAGGGLASRFAARSANASGARSSKRSGSTSESDSTSSAASHSLPAPGGSASGGAGSGAAATSGATVGQVAYVAKGTLYVTTLEGNTVKVKAATGATVTKSVDTSAASIHPGETVLVSGAAGADGTIIAQSIRAGSAGSGLSGGLLGGAGTRSDGASGSGSGGSAGAGSGTGSGSAGSEQALFGKG